jgi:hypothetical protein
MENVEEEGNYVQELGLVFLKLNLRSGTNAIKIFLP